MRAQLLYLSSLPLLFLALLPDAAVAQEEMARATPDRTALIENALSAAPAAISSKASVMDLEFNTLRVGSNGYTCLPDDPERPGNAPMCIDAAWMGFIEALLGETAPPPIQTIGIAYMLQGDFPVSNTEPYAVEATGDNEWIEDGGPHLMLLVPEAALGGMNHDPSTGEPWVMWRGTPYAHVMIPTARRE